MQIDSTPAWFAGRYRVVRELGRGGFATVLEAWDEVGRRPVALKLVDRRALELAGGMHRFRREATVLQHLAHPNIVRALDAGEHDGVPYLVLELLRGVTLESALRAGPLPLARVVAVARGLLGALREAHAAGVVHRDVKPANVFLCPHPGGELIKLLDFGVAKADGLDAARTAAGATLGTAAYMAPEQITGAPAVGPQADLFAVGLLVAEALSGAPIYGGGSGLAILVSKAAGRPVPLPPAVRASPLGAVVSRAVEIEPGRRWPSAEAMWLALEQAVAASAVGSAPTATALPAMADPLGATAPSGELRAAVEQARALAPRAAARAGAGGLASTEPDGVAPAELLASTQPDGVAPARRLAPTQPGAELPIPPYDAQPATLRQPSWSPSHAEPLPHASAAEGSRGVTSERGAIATGQGAFATGGPAPGEVIEPGAETVASPRLRRRRWVVAVVVLVALVAVGVVVVVVVLATTGGRDRGRGKPSRPRVTINGRDVTREELQGTAEPTIAIASDGTITLTEPGASVSLPRAAARNERVTCPALARLAVDDVGRRLAALGAAEHAGEGELVNVWLVRRPAPGVQVVQLFAIDAAREGPRGGAVVEKVAEAARAASVVLVGGERVLAASPVIPRDALVAAICDG